MEAMKATWTRSLSGLNGQQIRDALDYCADHEPYVPTLPRFREVCDQMKKADTVKALPRKFTAEEQDKNRERMKEAMSKLTGSVGNKQWARKLLKRVEDGDRSVADIAIRFAQEALAA